MWNKVAIEIKWQEEEYKVVQVWVAGFDDTVSHDENIECNEVWETSV